MEAIRHARYGILIGLLGLLFGTGWAFYLALNEGSIRQEMVSGIAQDAENRDEIVKISFKRLGMGHSHSMTLGLVAIAVSLVVSFTGAPDRIKTVVSLLSAMGGILFPLAWIIMGRLTPAMGPDGAHESVTPLAGVSVILFLSGIILTAFFLVRDIFSGSKQP